MTISEWLDNKEAEGEDVSHIVLPEDLANDQDPDETIFFKEIRECSILCEDNHPFSTVERFGHWYYCRGRDKEKGPHTTWPQWWMFTKDKDLAIKTAASHIEKAPASDDNRGYDPLFKKTKGGV
ncbi:MAG: hypothetical protein WC405_14010 [Syntrophales bacterium]